MPTYIILHEEVAADLETGRTGQIGVSVFVYGFLARTILNQSTDKTCCGERKRNFKKAIGKTISTERQSPFPLVRGPSANGR